MPILLLLGLQALVRGECTLQDEVDVLLERARTTENREEAKSLYLRAVRLNLEKGDGLQTHETLLYRLHPSDRELEALVPLHLEALKKDDSWKCAQALLRLQEEGKPTLGHYYTIELLKAFTAGKDLESAHRLERALAARQETQARVWALEIRGELTAIQGDLDGVVHHLETELAARPDDKSREPHPLLTPYL